MNFTREILLEKKIGVLMGGLSAEREVSLKTGGAVFESLKRQHFQAVEIDVDRDVCRRLKEPRRLARRFSMLNRSRGIPWW